MIVLLIVTPPEPIVKVGVEPARVTVPSSNVILLAVTVLVTVTV